MISSFSVWLLAAYSSIVIAGPLPKLRDQSSSLHYLNTSSTLIIASGNSFTSTSNLASVASSNTARQNAEANTAVMVEPIDHTVFTRTEPAITFVNPKGDPLVTQPEETLLSTSYITKPSSTETTSPKASLRASTLAALESLTRTTRFGFSIEPSGHGTSKLSERVTINTTTSRTASQAPMFTYEPGDATSTGNSSRPVITITISSFTTLTAGVNTSESQTGHPSVPANSNAGLTTALLHSTSALSPSHDNLSTTSTGGESSSSAKSTILVTSTEYTTLFPSTQTSPSSQLSSTAAASEPAAPVLTLSSTSSSTESVALENPSSSIPPELPRSSLLPPPIIVITPSAPGSSKPAASRTQPAASSDAFSASLSSLAEAPPSSSVALDPPSEPVPALTSPPSASLSVAPSPSASASSGPLVVVPIDTSRIFTVTETLTVTMTEKETMTVTATITT